MTIDIPIIGIVSMIPSYAIIGGFVLWLLKKLIIQLIGMIP